MKASPRSQWISNSLIPASGKPIRQKKHISSYVYAKDKGVIKTPNSLKAPVRTSKIGPTSVRGEKKLSPYKSNSLLQKIDGTVRDKVTILTQGSSARTSPRSGGQKSKNSGVRFSMADLTRHPNPVFHQDSDNYNDIEIEQIEDHATM